MLKRKSLDVFGLAKKNLQQEGKVDVPAYLWYGHNRLRDKCASGGIGLLVKHQV